MELWGTGVVTVEEEDMVAHCSCGVDLTPAIIPEHMRASKESLLIVRIGCER